jgi:DNA invertase Pin-like site-specific DNA recombinase
MLRAALYIRVSHEEQALHGYSLEAQKDALTKYAFENDMVIVDYYIDDGYTARKRYTKRKEFMRMLNDVEQDKIDIILFIKIDRWFRSVKDYYKIQEILEAHGVDWKTTMESYDTSTASGRLYVNIRLSIAQDESDRTGERIKFINDNKVSKGKVISGSVPLGLRIKNKGVRDADKCIVHDEETVHIARDAFLYYELHQTKRGTVVYIREKYGINLCYATMCRMLSNPIYKGEYRGNPNYCEPVIESERFDRIQEISDKNNVRVTPAGRVYIFASLIVCAECGHKMCGRAQKYGGKEYYYYRCNQFVQRGRCSQDKQINEKDIEEYLLENIESEINSYIVNYEIERAAAPKPRINKAKIKNKLTKLKELYVNDLISMEDYKKDFEMYTSQLQEPAEPAAPAVNIEALNSFLQSGFKVIYNTLTREEKRMLWRGVIKELRIDRNKRIRIFFA